MTQPEARLQRRIQERLRRRGAFAFKVHGGPTMMVGLPDIIVCHRGVYIGLEVKMPEGKTSRTQQYVHDKIRSAGGHVFVVTTPAEAESALDEVEAKFEAPTHD